MRRAGVVLLLLLAGAVLAGACGAARAAVIPLPEFTDHAIPETQHPAQPAGWLEYLDLAALAVTLVLSTLFALVVRRRLALYLLAAAALAWLGFWREGCVCSIGAIQNVSLALGDAGYAIPWFVVGFFALPLVFTLLFGRTFCGAVCPLGAIQELAAVRPVRVPSWLDHALGLVPYIYLGAAVLLAFTGTAFLICRYDPFVGFFRRSGSLEMLLFGAGLLVVGVFVGRPYCRYLCPYGAILRWLSKLSWRNVKIPPEECIHCRLCEDACPYGAIREPTVAQAPAERARGRTRLAGLLVVMPLLVGGGFALGRMLEVPLAHLNPTVALAERVAMEQSGQLDETTEASEAFYDSGRPKQELYAKAAALSGRLGIAGGLFGAWVGLVIGGKLIQLSVRRRRADYQPDRAKCVACGRCFWYCPGEQARRGLIREITLPPEEVTPEGEPQEELSSSVA